MIQPASQPVTSTMKRISPHSHYLFCKLLCLLHHALNVLLAQAPRLSLDGHLLTLASACGAPSESEMRPNGQSRAWPAQEIFTLCYIIEHTPCCKVLP